MRIAWTIRAVQDLRLVRTYANPTAVAVAVAIRIEA